MFGGPKDTCKRVWRMGALVVGGCVYMRALPSQEAKCTSPSREQQRKGEIIYSIYFGPVNLERVTRFGKACNINIEAVPNNEAASFSVVEQPCCIFLSRSIFSKAQKAKQGIYAWWWAVNIEHYSGLIFAIYSAIHHTVREAPNDHEYVIHTNPGCSEHKFPSRLHTRNFN